MSTRGKELLFFLTKVELVSVIGEFESTIKVSYHRTGTFPSHTTPMTRSLLEEPSLGELTIGDWNHSPNYLIASQKQVINVREIALRKGGYSYAVDQRINSDTVSFKPSGFFDERILIAGSLTTISDTAYSIKTFQEFAKIIKKRTTRIGHFYVGPDAKEKLQLGWRLVTIASSPKEYDLTLD